MSNVSNTFDSSRSVVFPWFADGRVLRLDLAEKRLHLQSVKILENHSRMLNMSCLQFQIVNRVSYEPIRLRIWPGALLLTGVIDRRLVRTFGTYENPLI